MRKLFNYLTSYIQTWSEGSKDPLCEIFLSLPWEIIEEICLFLPSKIITDILLKIPKLRPFIVKKYFSGEICFQIIHPSAKYSLLHEKVTKMPDFHGFRNADYFLSRNKDIAPDKYVFIAHSRSFHLEALLRKHRHVLSRARKLEIKLEMPYSPYLKDVEEPHDILMNVIYSFPNIHSIETWSGSGPCISATSTQTIKKLSLTTVDEFDWTNFSLPPSLTHFETRLPVYAFEMANRPWTVPHDDLFSLIWKLPLNTAPTSNQLRCPSLKSLTLVNFDLSQLDLSLLPPCLETLDMSKNRINRLTSGSLNARWPENLKHICLAFNRLSGVFLRQVLELGWPRLLQKLDLSHNEIESLDSLRNLPSSLEILSLDNNPYTALKPLKHLPRKLKTLHLGGSYALEDANWSFDDWGRLPIYLPNSLRCLSLDHCSSFARIAHESGSMHAVSSRIHFPPNLESLNLENCELTSLSLFVFPASLKTLTLSQNHIKNLNSYNFWSGPHEVVNWKHLTNLKELYLEGNRIQSLRNWIPPKSLRTLDLQFNMIKRLDWRSTPLFDKEYSDHTKNIHSLNLSGNRFIEIDHQLNLPCNLNVLKLCRNKISDFEFSKVFVLHENLFELDLSCSPIRTFSVSESATKKQSNIKVLNLSHLWEDSFKMSAEELYRVFELAGFSVAEKHPKVLRKHVFG